MEACYEHPTFHAWAEKWLEEVIEPKGISKGAYTKYLAAVKHMEREFGERDLRTIRLSDFQRFINRLAKENPNTGRPMSKASLYNIKKVGNNIFRYARQNDVEGVSDFFGILQIPNNAPVKKRAALSEEAIDAVVHTMHRARPMAMTMLFAGLRLGEAVPLTWKDIDFQKKFIYITKTADLQDNTPRIKEGGKTAAATRMVPLPPILEETLLSWQKEQGAGHTYLFEKVQGEAQLMTRRSFKVMWANYMTALNEGRPENEQFHFTAHNLRHTYATMLYLQDVDVRDAMQCMGHANIQVTMNIYTDTHNYFKFGLSDSMKEKMENEYRIFRKL